MANHISIRYDTQHSPAWKDVLRSLHKEFPETEYTIYREIGYLTKKEHYHIHLICTKDVNFVRNRFTRTDHYKVYPTKNDKSWYCRLVRDLNSHIMYITKDGDCIVDQLATIAHKDFIGKWIPKEDFKQDKIGAVYQYVDDNYNNWLLLAKQEWTLRDVPDKREMTIRMLVREWHVLRRKTFGKYMIDAYVNLIIGMRLYKNKKEGFQTALELEKRLAW